MEDSGEGFREDEFKSSPEKSRKHDLVAGAEMEPA